MLELLVPAEYRPSVYGVDPEALRRQGIRGVILDLDNTLTRWDRAEPSEALLRWIESVRAAGLELCIVSNNTEPRVQRFCRALQVPGIHKAVKPRRASFRRAMERMGTSPAQTAVVGDQIFTDILGGNRLGLYTILVAPVATREFAGTRLVRRLESAWLAYLRRRGRLPRLEELTRLDEGRGAPAAKK